MASSSSHMPSQQINIVDQNQAEEQQQQSNFTPRLSDIFKIYCSKLPLEKGIFTVIYNYCNNQYTYKQGGGYEHSKTFWRKSIHLYLVIINIRHKYSGLLLNLPLYFSILIKKTKKK